MRNPVCYFWNHSNEAWENRGVETLQVQEGEVREFKTFTVRANSSHLGAFAVLVQQDAEIEVCCVCVCEWREGR